MSFTFALLGPQKFVKRGNEIHSKYKQAAEEGVETTPTITAAKIESKAGVAVLPQQQPE